jgi:hypothetical protein
MVDVSPTLTGGASKLAQNSKGETNHA